MKEPTLYTFGYLSGRGERIINELIALRTPIVDVRYNPASRKWQYTQDAMMARDNIIYHHIPALGNELYKEALSGKFTEPHIRLHNQERGLAMLKYILDQYGRCAIFCACSNKTACHRIMVADLAREEFGVKVVHL